MSKRPVTQSNVVFATADIGKIQRSTFIRPSSLKTSFNCGKLVPVYVDEVLPGDTFKIDMKFLSRLTTPVFPTMDDITLEFYAFFVPNRLVWNGWEELCGENKTGAWLPQDAPALVPVVEDGGGTMTQISKRLGDYYGIPVGCNVSYHPISCLPFRGYTLIWNEWFRDENLQAPVPLSLGNSFYETVSTLTDGNGYGLNSGLASVNKFHDYFTSALPSPQRGSSPLIPIELNKLIPVITGDRHDMSSLPNMTVYTSGDSLSDAALADQYVTLGMSHATADGSFYNGHFYGLNMSKDNKTAYDGGKTSIDNLWADARNIGSLNETTISQLRTLFQIQKLYERDARGGTRYREMLLSHFGVDAGDYRLQRPEFLGKFVARVGMQSVPQTSSTDATSPQGNLAAYSLTTGSSTIVDKSFVEHGFIHIFAVARQVKTYQQGIERFWSRRERFDFYYPTLAHISEQPIYNREIYAFPDTETVEGVDTQVYHGDEVFGYQEAWADYRYKPNKVTGQMRSGVSNSYDVWHYADVYSETPKLSSGWITDNSATNVDRTLAVSSATDDQIKMDVAFVCKATRPMPIKSIPGLVDHF